MKVKYVGPYEAVDVPIPGSITGASIQVKNGEWLDTTEEHALSLAEQETWTREGVTKKSTAKARDNAVGEPTPAEITESALNPSEED